MRNRSANILTLVAVLVGLTGLLTLDSALWTMVQRHNVRLILIDAHLTVIAGLSLIYLATMLRRGKNNAWMISIGVYTFLIARNLRHLVIDFHHGHGFVLAALNLVIPVATMALLIAYHRLYIVRSEPRSFAIALRRSILILAVALVYGVVGFSLLDEHDYHREISVPAAIYHTIDQFGLNSSQQLVAYSRRARLFSDSLAAVGLTSAIYVAISFFAPVRFRLSHRRQDYELAKRIVYKHSKSCEDFFKLWPRDKNYYLNSGGSAVVAYRVAGGVALSIGDPCGPQQSIRRILESYLEYCRLNDWAAAFIHTDRANLALYKRFGFDAQTIGREALVDISHFNSAVASNKYFRHIQNKFSKQKYSCEPLSPPHSRQLINELRIISKAWLSRPGRGERGMMMGYFNEEYLQLCDLVVVRDPAGQVKAFLNRIPSPKADEATYDFLRHSSDAPGNINDYLMINFIKQLGAEGIETLNMGLAPLTGLKPASHQDHSVVDSVLRFVSENAERFYSFQGLARFKAKYEPRWEDRYIVYRGGLPGFTRTMNSLIKAMSLKHRRFIR